MPYIAKSERGPYDKGAELLLSALDPEAWRQQLAPVICEIGRRVYGDPDSTRYYRQNEFLGVLGCMANEWQDRLRVPAYGADASLSFESMGQSESAQFEDTIALVVGLLQKEADEARPAKLNYLLTWTMIGVVEAAWCPADYPPSYVRAMARWVYQTVVRPFEDRAKARNGDVFPEKWFAPQG